MLDNINEILLTLTVALAVAAVAVRLLLRANRIEWIKRFLTWLLEYVDVGLSALVIALVVRSFVVEPFKIPSSSMEDTLLIGDQLFVNRFIYGMRIPYISSRPLALRKPVRGDIVVFIPPHRRDTDFIKRVIGTPGDTIEIKNQVVSVNGRVIEEPYVRHKEPRILSRLNYRRDNLEKITVPPGKYFMMGDNRDRSEDSRYWGYASLADMKGKAMIIYFSWNHENATPAWNLVEKIRWRRLFRAIR